MTMYKLYKTSSGADAACCTDEQGRMISFIFAPDNTDYQAFLLWISEGNVPTPADEVTQ